ncbi:MAG: hypothetical protein ACHBNF_08930 [Chromatiales bacterium]
MIAKSSYYERDPNVPDRDLSPVTVTSVESMEYVAPTKRIAWGAVFAGVVLAIGIQVLLNMLGTGIGASTIDPLRGDTPNAESWACRQPSGGSCRVFLRSLSAGGPPPGSRAYRAR